MDAAADPRLEPDHRCGPRRRRAYCRPALAYRGHVASRSPRRRTAAGRVPTVTPRTMSREEIHRTVTDYARAARNAMIAGFDGVLIQANYLYLLAQFLNRATNRRTDEYGGDIEGRARFLFEVVEAILDEIEPAKVGVKIGPMHETGPFVANDETLPMAEYAIHRASSLKGTPSACLSQSSRCFKQFCTSALIGLLGSRFNNLITLREAACKILSVFVAETCS